MSARCCCHDFDERCGHGFPERHVHRCLPRALDLGGHCPDGACLGDCWQPPADHGDGSGAGGRSGGEGA